MPDLTIACTLTPGELPARRALIAALVDHGVLDRTRTPAGLRVRLYDTPEVERRTRALIAAEARCCAFLRFELRRADGALVLDVSGPPEARPLIDEFFATAATARRA